MLEHAGELSAFAEEVRADGFTDAALLGMGGSSLGPEVIRRSFGEIPDGLRLHVLDSTDPGAVRELEGRLDLEKTLFIVSSKSGGTVETLSHMRYFFERSGGDGKRFVAITDPGSPLVELARERGFRQVFENDPDIGGRYSVLSLLRARARGADGRQRGGAAPERPGGRAELHELRRHLVELGPLAGRRDGRAGAPRAATSSRSSSPTRSRASASGPSSWSPSRRASRARASCRWPTSRWGARRLRRRPRVRVPAQRGRARRAARREGPGAQPGRPRHDHARRARSRGPRRIFFFAEFATAVAGWVLGHQPVRPAQRAGGQGQHGQGARRCPSRRGSRTPTTTPCARCSARPRPPHYVAIMGYVKPSEAFDAAIAELRAAIRDGTKATTTFGYGPRFLHSTGQFHKGGPPTGLFLQLVHDGEEDVEVPEAELHVRDAEGRPGRRRPPDAARPRPAGRARAPRQGTPPRRCAV